MVRPRGLALSAAAVVFVWAAAAAAADVRPTDLETPVVAEPTTRARLLDVPYLTQTEDLCGGAAVAMVLRYWGERRVYPEDFAGLVDRSASGIRTDVLAADVRRRGWQALATEGGGSADGDVIRGHVDHGRPIVALIEVRPNRYHYVVIVAWSGEHVIVHDPARGPFRVMSQAEFDHAWALAGRWALLLLPSESPSSEPELSSESPGVDAPPTSECGALVREKVALARAGDVGGAEAGLLAAVRLCPLDPAAWRELAGVRFLQSQWAHAGTLAERAVLLDPSDAQVWDLVATSRFLNDEPEAALEAWNHIGHPAVDLVRIEGASRTRHPVIASLVGLPPRTLLTVDRYGRAARRLQELPSVVLTRLSYRPIPGGLAEIEAAVVERSTVPRSVSAAVTAATRAWLQREVVLDVAAPAGSGELWTLAWRWEEARPRLAFALAVPAASWLPGVATIEGAWERPSYATPSAEGPEMVSISRTERRRASFGLADWATRSVRWKAGVALDRWAHDSHLSVDAAIDLRLVADHMSIGIDTAAWVPIGTGERFARSAVSWTWRSSRDNSRQSWLAIGGLSATSGDAPLDLWSGAGTGSARTPLLRAHPLLDAGVLSGPVFGRRLANATVEYGYPLRVAQGTTIRLAAFVDTARAWRRMGDEHRPSWQMDVGTGIRIALPGHGGAARLDVGRGLRDGQHVLSAGWQAPWPAR